MIASEAFDVICYQLKILGNLKPYKQHFLVRWLTSTLKCQYSAFVLLPSNISPGNNSYHWPPCSHSYRALTKKLSLCRIERSTTGRFKFPGWIINPTKIAKVIWKTFPAFQGYEWLNFNYMKNAEFNQ